MPTRTSSVKGPRTLCIDIGGSGVKLMVVDGAGEPRTERLRVETPRPATPAAVLGVVRKALGEIREPYDRVSVGFPGVVLNGVTRTAPNLSPAWGGFDLGKAMQKLTGKPARVGND